MTRVDPGAALLKAALSLTRFQSKVSLTTRAPSREDGMQRLNETAGGDIYKDVPHTVYSQRVQEGVYPNDTIFGSKPRGPNPFAKNTEYSKPITDHTKDPAYVE